MLKQISNLGTRLSKKELKNVLGGGHPCGRTGGFPYGPCDPYCFGTGGNACYNNQCWVCY